VRPLVLVLAVFTTATVGIAPRARSGPELPLAWLAGCWETTRGTSVVEEQWMAPRGGVMMGMSRTTKDDAVQEYEFLRIYRSGDTLTYAAMPSGQPSAEFKAPLPTGPRVVFANPAHDFPHRIIYERVTADSVAARIEGDRAGLTRGISFGYRRVKCG
jgi:hypothetical protein